MADIEQYLDQRRPSREKELFELLRIPSVSTESSRRGDVARAARWLTERLQAMGLAAEQIETEGHPLVYAETPPVAGRPVALVYGHYDVQPAEPLEPWLSPPFEPTVRDGNVYARGATDDKGQLLTHLGGVEAWLARAEPLPLQVKFLIEGEEEIGSGSLRAFLPSHRDKLACDCVVISDTSQLAPGRPAITYGLRGIVYYELLLSGPARDLHSGSFGGAVTNPANTLCRLLAALVDSRGRICVPGFYDDVLPLTEQERQRLQAIAPNEAKFAEELGVEGLSGEEGFSALERRWARPACDVHGLWGGFQAEGAKTVLPARAGAKFSFRLVPRQDPEKLSRALRGYLEGLLPPGIRMQLVGHQGSPATLVPLESPYLKAASRAIEHAFGRPPELVREGGSIPIVGDFNEQLGAEILLLGWGQNDDNAHGPNEKFCLADFHRGAVASARLWKELAEC